MGINFRDLTADEIEVRAAQVTERGASLLIYKDARVDMRILDETVGPGNWQKEFYENVGTLFCRVGIRISRKHADGTEETPEWVWKADAGEPSNTSADKGRASDAFKRACINWGIGRELYTAPRIWIPAEKLEIVKGSNGKYQLRSRLAVAKIGIEGGRITGIRIVNGKGAVVYSWKRS